MYLQSEPWPKLKLSQFVYQWCTYLQTGFFEKDLICHKPHSILFYCTGISLLCVTHLSVGLLIVKCSSFIVSCCAYVALKEGLKPTFSFDMLEGYLLDVDILVKLAYISNLGCVDFSRGIYHISNPTVNLEQAHMMSWHQIYQQFFFSLKCTTSILPYNFMLCKCMGGMEILQI